MSNVVVTGGSGFIGSHVVKRLVDQGHRVLALDIQDARMFEYPEGSEYVRQDVRNGLTLSEQMQRWSDKTGAIDGIIHLAGLLGTQLLLEHEEEAVSNNVIGTLNVLRMARKFDTKYVTPRVANKWANPYTITKSTAWEFALMFHREWGLNVTGVKETHVYGPRQDISALQKIFPTLVGNALIDKPIPLFNNGESRVDLIHAEDCAESLIRCVLNPDEFVGETVEFMSERLMTVRQLAEAIIDATDSKSELQLLGRRPGQHGEDDDPTDPGRLMRSCGSWETIPLEVGIPETCDWYRQHFNEVGGWYLQRD